MKKLKWFVIPVLVLGLPALWVCLGPEPDSLGVALSDISSVEVYNESSLEKKVVSRQEDVEKVLKSIDSQYVRGPFEDSDIVQIRISAKNAITSMTKPAVTEAGVIYTDIANMSYEISNKTAVDLGAVTAVRLGAHDSSTRIAVDTKV